MPSFDCWGVMLRVLVVEPDPDSGESLAKSLRRQGYEASTVASGEQALAEHHHAELVLIDLELPDIDGLEVCREIRGVSDTPLIAVTARGSELDRVLAFQAGIDDYLVEPYGFRELMARCEAVMRRVRRSLSSTSTVVKRGPLHINRRSRDVHIDGKKVELTRKEFDLLHILASQPETVFSRKELASRVWAGTCTESSRTIDTHVSSLRTKLGASTWITTIRGVGFRFGYGESQAPWETEANTNGTNGDRTSEISYISSQCPHCGAVVVSQAS